VLLEKTEFMEVAKNKKIIIIGKLPPPIMGPALANKIILNSDLKNRYDLVHFDITINKTIKTQGVLSLKKVFQSLNLYWIYWKTVRKEKPDLVFMTSFSQSVVGFYKDIPYLVIPRLFKTKVIGQLRGSNFKNLMNSTNSLNAGIMRWVLRKIDGVVVLGNNLKYIFSDIVQSEKIFVVPNGANYSFPVVKKTNEKINVLYLANMYKTKGVHCVVEAAIKLNNSNCSFTFAGGWRSDEKFKDDLTMKIEESNIDITVLPPVSGIKKFELFAKSDIFVFPPIAPEGHPWVLVEAMAAGLPIISTDQGAIVESVIDGENGYIVAPNSPDEIAEKLQLLIDKKDIRKEMASKSKQFHTDKFSEERMVENFSAVFNKVIEH
jgi:glycosyltransferase involved in cell wall biosynthesis